MQLMRATVLAILVIFTAQTIAPPSAEGFACEAECASYRQQYNTWDSNYRNYAQSNLALEIFTEVAVGVLCAALFFGLVCALSDVDEDLRHEIRMSFDPKYRNVLNNRNRYRDLANNCRCDGQSNLPRETICNYPDRRNPRCGGVVELDPSCCDGNGDLVSNYMQRIECGGTGPGDGGVATSETAAVAGKTTGEAQKTNQETEELDASDTKAFVPNEAFSTVVQSDQATASDEVIKTESKTQEKPTKEGQAGQNENADSTPTVASKVQDSVSNFFNDVFGGSEESSTEVPEGSVGETLSKPEDRGSGGGSRASSRGGGRSVAASGGKGREGGSIESFGGFSKLIEGLYPSEDSEQLKEVRAIKEEESRQRGDLKYDQDPYSLFKQVRNRYSVISSRWTNVTYPGRAPAKARPKIDQKTYEFLTQPPE